MKLVNNYIQIIQNILNKKRTISNPSSSFIWIFIFLLSWWTYSQLFFTENNSSERLFFSNSLSFLLILNVRLCPFLISVKNALTKLGSVDSPPANHFQKIKFTKYFIILNEVSWGLSGINGTLFIENYSAKNLPASKIRRFFDLDKTTTVGKDVVKSIHKKKRRKKRKKR